MDSGALDKCGQDLKPTRFEDLKRWDTCEKLVEDLTNKAKDYKDIPDRLERLARLEHDLAPLRDMVQFSLLLTPGRSLTFAAIWDVLHLLISVSGYPFIGDTCF